MEKLEGVVPEIEYPAIKVWPFKYAPAEFRSVSTNGGDEDWLAYVPDTWRELWIPWLETGHFGVCSVDEYEIGNGDVVRIGSHA